MPRPQRQAPPYDAAGVVRLMARQSGVVSRAQLAGLGVTPADIRRAVRGRRLFRLGPGVYADTAAGPTALQRAWWACLHFKAAAVADETALQLARDAGGRHVTAPIHIAVGSDHHARALPGVVLHRVGRLTKVVAWHGSPPRMQAPHAALRVASRERDDNDLVARLAEAVNWRVVTPTRLLDALDDLPRLPRRRFIREVLVDLTSGACSVLEREYLLRVERAHGLPAGLRQAPRRTSGGREFRDVEYVDHDLVVELDGRATHSGKQAWDRDMERDLDDALQEKRAVRLGWRQVFGTPCRTAAKVALLLQRRGWPGDPRPCGPDCALVVELRLLCANR